MRYMIIFCILFFAEGLSAQSVVELNGRWAFTGLRTTVFKVEHEKLFVGMLEYTDTLNFSRFLQMAPLDSSIYSPAHVTMKNDTIMIEVTFAKIDHHLRLIYSQSDTNHILFTGDVFFDSASVIAPNRNCSISIPACSNRLYSKQDIASIMNLKTPESFSRDDAFEFLLRLNEKFRSTCNSCYAGFTDAYMNGVFIEMGFNPIIRRVAAKSVWYNTSGFTYFVKMKFQDDQRILRMTDFVFDRYLHR